jgi:(R,R)-butanediol dehydrogenase / meso-butanediol dehydrogenase / diacetyl reductase
MKAAQFYGKEDLRLEDVPEPSPGPGEVKLQNAFAGICGSDLHFYYSPEDSGVDFEHPNPVTGATLPQVLGHEFSGTVVELGAGVTSVRVGDRVAVLPIYSCGECPACRNGRYNLCRNVGIHGVSAHGGGMAEFTTVSASMLHVLPDDVDLRMGALVEPMSVAWHAVRRSGVEADGTALVAGAGPIGIGVWFALRARGLTKVIVSEPSAERRATIAALGATVVDPVHEDLAAAVAELTESDGVDVAFDAAGANPAVTSALASLTPGGRIVVVALHERPTEVLLTPLALAENEIVGAAAYLPEDFDAVIRAMAEGFYDTTGWVEQGTLDEVLDALGTLRAGSGAKILLEPR